MITEYTGAVHALQYRTHRTALAYSADMTPDLANGSHFIITPNNGSAFAISAPGSGVVAGLRIAFTIINTTGGALGALTWESEYNLAGSWTQPDTGNRRTIEFESDGTDWFETHRTAANVPN